ncbi:hypothetical protein PM082_017071 [Marasmius tenuissimus]|nr:hypothetical protein PM082_017071 [Marasmius tenuissimus]
MLAQSLDSPRVPECSLGWSQGGLLHRLGAHDMARKPWPLPAKALAKQSLLRSSSARLFVRSRWFGPPHSASDGRLLWYEYVINVNQAFTILFPKAFVSLDQAHSVPLPVRRRHSLSGFSLQGTSVFL